MSKLPKIMELMENEGQMKRLLDIRMTEEIDRLDGVPGITPSQFTFFEAARENQHVISAYDIMQRQYVLRECDRIPYENALEALCGIKQSLMKNNAWNIAVIPTVKETEVIRHGRAEDKPPSRKLM